MHENIRNMDFIGFQHAHIDDLLHFDDREFRCFTHRGVEITRGFPSSQRETRSTALNVNVLLKDQVAQPIRFPGFDERKIADDRILENVRSTVLSSK